MPGGADMAGPGRGSAGDDEALGEGAGQSRARAWLAATIHGRGFRHGLHSLKRCMI